MIRSLLVHGRMKPLLRAFVFILLVLLLAPTAMAQDQEGEQNIVTLPEPTGTFAVGYVSWEWTDPERPDPFSETGKGREIVVHAWYPASVPEDARPGDYRPLARQLFSDVRKHSYPAAPFEIDAGPSPVLLICPGRGMSSLYYTTLAEELASHGYVVLAVDSPLIGFASFRDGRIIFAAGRYQIPFEVLTGPYEYVDKFFAEPTEIGAADIDFVLNKIRKLNSNDPAGRFTGHLDFTAMGAFGHSLGGRICGAVVGSQENFTAYATMEGVPPRDIRRGGMKQAVAMLYSSELPEEMALPNIEEVVPERRADVFITRFEGMGHNSLTDRPFIRPDDFNYSIDPREALLLGRQYLLGFFDAYVRNANPFDETVGNNPHVSSRRFEKD